MTCFYLSYRTAAQAAQLGTLPKVFVHAGEENLQSLNVTSSSAGFRDLYDDSVIPQMSLEALTAMRWVHTFQDGTLE